MAPSSNTANNSRNVLPDNVKPIHYDVVLVPDLNKFVFSGSSNIELQVLRQTDEVKLHAHEIELTSVFIESSGNSTEAKSSTYSEKDQTFTLKFPAQLEPSSKVSLKLEFSGILNDQMNGFYRSSYTDNKGNKKFMASTQFEATEARRAFPCFDEPSLKATFSITLKVDPNHTALSNMDVQHESNEGTHKVVKFNKTPIMSTYLVAFAVGEFDFIEDYTNGENGQKIKCRVYTTKGLSEQGRFSLNVATRTLDLFNKVFGIAYPLPKLDMLAVPDFDAGAMENWGLVTYRTVLLLFEEGKSAAKTKQRIASVVAHELAHQWFGNIVTMEWWSHLWLNEGFATWVGTYAVDKLFPEWEVWTQFFADDMARGLSLDSMRSSHPIEVEVNEASEINQIFDAISYSKGASVIRMLSQYLSEEVFLQGIQVYLKRHAYKNASTKDLWQALSEVSKKDVSKFMELWTKRVGYPLLEVSSNEKNKITIKQTRYLSSGLPNSDEDEIIWWVPLRYLEGSINDTQDPETKNDVLANKEATFEIDTQNGSYYKFNHDQTGVYRVKYPIEQVQNFGKLIKMNKVLTNLDKIGIISDVSSLAQSGHSKITHFLELLPYFKNEKNYLVLSEIASTMSKILSVWFEQPQKIIDKLKQVRLEVFKHLVKEVGWDPRENETERNPLMPMLRSLVIANAGLSGDEEVIKEARKRFDDYMNNNNTNVIHADIKGAVYSIILNEGNEQDYEKVLNNYLETELPDQKMIALSSLGTVKNKDLINKALNFCISDKVRNQDIIYIMASLGSNPEGRRTAFEFIKTHWTLLESKYKTNLSILGSLIKYTAAQLTTKEDYEDLKKFFANKDTKPIQRSLQQSLEQINASMTWLQRDKEEVENWLQNYGTEH